MPITFKGFLRNLLDAQVKVVASILQYEDLGDPNQLRTALEEQVKNNPESLLALRTYPGMEEVQEYINLLYTQRRGGRRRSRNSDRAISFQSTGKL